MQRAGTLIFTIGATIAVTSGILMSLGLGTVCNLTGETLPESVWSYQALCFIYWAYSVPVGIILAATGAIVWSGAGRGAVWIYLAGALAAYAAIAIANDPIPHVPPLFGIGGALLLLFYFLTLRTLAPTFRTNPFKPAGLSFLVIGFWFACGWTSRQYHPIFGDMQSPIDIMAYFVIGMGFLWLGERRAVGQARRGRQGPVAA